MSIIIKGVKPPINCQACFLKRIFGYCQNAKRKISFDEWNDISKRPNWCPVVEIPEPHGRLIDEDNVIDAIHERLQTIQPDNQVHLCDSCRHVYPECPSEKDDVIFGNGKGNDNICACNKYEPSVQP